MPVASLPLPVISNLLSGPRFTETELLELNRVIIERIKILRRLSAAQFGRSLSIGDSVTWSGRKGVYTGRVAKINRKTAKVAVGPTTWTVPMNMLALV